MENVFFITEKNQLIAEFMGYFNWEDKSYGNYDKDWNMLMSVVGKIQDLGYVFLIGKRSATWSKPGVTFLEMIGDSIWGKTTIEATYNTVVKFIQWYNTPKHETNAINH